MRVPPFRGQLPRPALTFLAAVGGTSLYDRPPRRGRDRDDVRAAASDAARAARAALRRPTTACTPPPTSSRCSRRCGRSRWPMSSRSLDSRRAAGDRASSRAQAADVGRRVIHRDFYDKQVLVDGRAGPCLARRRHGLHRRPGARRRQLLAQLRLRRPAVGSRRAAGERLRGGLLDAYRGRALRTRLVPPRHLVRLACAYSLRPRWRHIAPALLASSRPPPQVKSRILFYSHDTFGLGHFRRSLTIAASGPPRRRRPRADAHRPRLAASFEATAGVDFVKLPGVAKCGVDRSEAAT